MNRNLFFITVFAFFTIAAFKTEAQWAQLGGPNGGSVNTLITVDNKLFAGTDNGVYLSIDTGSSWKSVNEGLPDDKNIEALATNGEYIFAGFLWDGIYRSSINDSCNWKSVAEKISGDFISSLAAQGSTILAGMSSGKMLISTDNGVNWSVKDSGFGNFPLHSIALRDSLILVGGETEMFISTDYGTTWENPNIDDICGFDCVHLGDSAFFAANNYGNVFRSTDNGSNWIQAVNGLENVRIETFATEGNTVYGGSCSYFPGEIAGVFKSTDRGENWTRIDSASINKNILSLALSGEKIIAGTENNGIFQKQSSDNVWARAIKGLYPVISCLYVTSCELFAGTEHGLFLSTDGCKTWTIADSIKASSKITALARNGDTFFAGTDSDGIYSSVDNGTTWRKTNAFDSILCITVNDSFTLAGNTRGIQRCRVDDSVWTWVNEEFPRYGILSIAAHDSMVFAGGYYSGAFRSTDYGKNWSPIDTISFPASITRSFAICGDTVFASLLLGGVYRSIDNGISWAKLTGLSSSGYGDLAIIDSTVVVSAYGNIYYTTNYGLTWRQARLGLEDKNVYSFFTAGNELYAGTEFDGVWHRSISDLLTPVIGGKTPRSLPQSTDFNIKFNGSTNFQGTIGFTLSKPMHVKIKVYDMRGREITSPVNDYFVAGAHIIKWNTRNIASGFYVAKMYAGTNVWMANIAKIH